MKRVSSRQLPGLLAEVQLTPLLDLVLMLMLAVLVLVPVLRETRPGAAPTPAVHSAPKNTLELVVAGDLKLTFAGGAVDERELIGELRKRVAADPNLGVLVRVPAELKSPALLQIMEALRSASVRHTAVATEPSTQP
jgi:biopolymer transport protein ExbD